MCKQWRELSLNRSVLSHHFSTANLHRAFGPAQWHSDEELIQYLLQSARLTSNLNLDEPPVVQHRVHTLPIECTAGILHQPQVCGQLLIVFLDNRSLVCSDIDDPEGRIVWKHDFSFNGSRVWSCFSESITSRVGFWVVSIAVSGLQNV